MTPKLLRRGRSVDSEIAPQGTREIGHEACALIPVEPRVGEPPLGALFDLATALTRRIETETAGGASYAVRLELQRAQCISIRRVAGQHHANRDEPIAQRRRVGPISGREHFNRDFRPRPGILGAHAPLGNRARHAGEAWLAPFTTVIVQRARRTRLSLACHMRVLCADDEADIRTILELALSLAPGIEPTIVTDGTEVMARAGEGWDAIVLDGMMPGLDGFETCRRLKADASTANIPVVFLTAKTSRDDIQRALALGAVGCLSKPFDPMTLGADLIGMIPR